MPCRHGQDIIGLEVGLVVPKHLLKQDWHTLCQIRGFTGIGLDIEQLSVRIILPCLIGHDFAIFIEQGAISA